MALTTIYGTRRRTWEQIHPDFKGVHDGVKYVLVMNETGQTVSMPYKDARKRGLI